MATEISVAPGHNFCTSLITLLEGIMSAMHSPGKTATIMPYNVWSWTTHDPDEPGAMMLVSILSVKDLDFSD